MESQIAHLEPSDHWKCPFQRVAHNATLLFLPFVTVSSDEKGIPAPNALITAYPQLNVLYFQQWDYESKQRECRLILQKDQKYLCSSYCSTGNVKILSYMMLHCSKGTMGKKKEKKKWNLHSVNYFLYLNEHFHRREDHFGPSQVRKNKFYSVVHFFKFSLCQMLLNMNIFNGYLYCTASTVEQPIHYFSRVYF